MYRDHTKVIQIGNRKIGGGNPILIQSMTNTKTEDVDATVSQILSLEQAGCDIIRCAVPTMEAARALYFDTFVNSEDCTCIRNFCKEIGIPEKTAVALLLDHRYLYRSPSGWLMPFADKSARGYFIVRDCYGRSGKLVQQTRVTCKGKNHLFKLFKKWGVIE